MSATLPLLVTGANRRVGLALTRRLLAEGQPVIAVYRDDPGPLRDLEIEAYQVDLAEEAQRDTLLQQLHERHPALRGIVHNASVWAEDGLENLRLLYRLHLEAPYHLNLGLQELLLAAPRADIIHIGDDSATRGSRNHIGYAATKAALHNLTLSFAEALAPRVRVNTIAPGLLIFKEGAAEAYRQATLDKALLDFEPGADPIVDTVLYLLSTQYATGSTFTVNGGRHLRHGRR